MVLVFWFITFILFRFGYNCKDNCYNNRNCSNTCSNRNTYNHRPIGLVSCHNVINAESPSTLVTGVVVARTEFIEQNPQAVEDFLKHYQESVDYVNKNVNEGAALVGKYDIVTEAVAQKAIPECNITFISGNEMKEKLSGYLSVLNDQNAKSIGGKLPADDFYYNA